MTQLDVCEVEQKITELTEREKDVLILRSSGKTLQEIADEYGVTKERVRQIEAKALRKTRTKEWQAE